MGSEACMRASVEVHPAVYVTALVRWCTLWISASLGYRNGCGMGLAVVMKKC